MSTTRKYTSPQAEESVPVDEPANHPVEKPVEKTPEDVRQDQEYLAWREQKDAEKRKAEQVAAARERGEYETVEDRIRVESNGETVNDPNGGMIVYIQNAVPDDKGGVKEVVHGPMPRGEWAKYAAEKGL